MTANDEDSNFIITIKTEELQIDSILPDEGDSTDCGTQYESIESDDAKTNSDFRLTSVENELDIDDSRPQLKCYLCPSDNAFVNSLSLRKHLKKCHLPGTLNRCVKCSFESEKVLLFNKHLHQHEQKDCDKCGQKFSRRGALKRHKLIMHGDDVFRACTHCGIDFSLHSILRHEQLCERKLYSISCGECDKRFKTRHSLAKHEQVCKGKELSQLLTAENKLSNMEDAADSRSEPTSKHDALQTCDRCGLELSVYSISKHKQTCTGAISFQSCDECEKKFARKYSLAKHKRICHGSRLIPLSEKMDRGKEAVCTFAPYLKCFLCPTYPAFNSKEILWKHLKDQHKSKELNSCKECSFKSKNILKLNKHFIRHVPRSIRSEGCDECGKMFTQESSLIRHKRFFHSGVHMEACSKCGHKYSIRSISVHQTMCKMDSGFAPCEECGKKFKTSHGLANHKRGCRGSILPRKPSTRTKVAVSLSCDRCGREFGTKYGIANHKRSCQGSSSSQAIAASPTANSPLTIKTEELQIDSILPEESYIPDWNSTSVAEKTEEDYCSTDIVIKTEALDIE